MKKLILILLPAFLFTACNTNTHRYTQDSPEIEIVKAAVNDYDYQQWEALIARYSDTAKIYYNTRSNILNPKNIKAYHAATDANFSTRAFEDGRKEYEMVTDNDGKKWVNFWGIWEGNLAANNKKIVVPIHITYQFVDGKIVNEFGYWNTAELVLELQQIEIEKAANAVKIDSSETELDLPEIVEVEDL